jgi:hypothetical protein
LVGWVLDFRKGWSRFKNFGEILEKLFSSVKSTDLERECHREGVGEEYLYLYIQKLVTVFTRVTFCLTWERHYLRVRFVTDRQREFRRFIRSSSWLDLSKRKLSEVGRCEDCWSDYRLRVLFRKRLRRFDQLSLDDLTVICARCHRVDQLLKRVYGGYEVRQVETDFLSKETIKTVKGVYDNG